MSNKAKQRSNEPVALFAGVWQFVVMVAVARKHGQGGAGVWRADRVALWVVAALHHPKRW